MDRTSAPFVVLKPVRTTAAKATVSMSFVVASFGRRARIILVPAKRKCFATGGLIDGRVESSECNVSFVAGDFETGTDSPVNMLSLTIQSPVMSRESHGT